MNAFHGAVRLSADLMPDLAEERALLEKCRKQDFEAFGKLVDAYQARVFGFVRRMVSDGEDAADITQDVFIRAFQNIARFDGRSSVRTWLFRIAHNLCIDRSRRLARGPQPGPLSEGFEDETPLEIADSRWQPEQIVLNEEMAAVVEDGIRTMSEKLRSVLLLHDKEDVPYEEIARILEVPVGTVKSRLFLARAHLQNTLRSYFETGGAN